MSRRILVAYASGSGSTAEVAEAIAQTLRQRETVAVEVQAASEIATLDAYDALVLGSSIRVGRWLPGAVNFVKRLQATMAQMPVAYFMTCLAMVKDTPETRRQVLSYLEPVLQLAPAVDPVGIGLFAGSLAPEIGQIFPGEEVVFQDFRDWEAIIAWAEEVRPRLLAPAARPAAPLVLSQMVLSYTDMSGLDLSHIEFAQAELHETKLRRANLQGADMRASEMTRADLSGAKLQAAALGWADLSGATLRAADLHRANLIGAILTNADLREANLSQAVLNGATLAHANLAAADLSGADLNWANLKDADLSGADLRHASLNWADFTRARLIDVNVQAATCNLQTKWPADFSPEQAGCIMVDQTQ